LNALPLSVDSRRHPLLNRNSLGFSNVHGSRGLFLHVLLSAFAFGFGDDSAVIEGAEWAFPKRTSE
jgi:hypothetical protein